MIELNIAAGVLQALALFVSARAGTRDPNPNAAIHLRYVDDFGIRLAATNGTQIVFLRLCKDSDQLSNFYWPEEEQGHVLSILLTSQALAALAKMGARVVLSASTVHCKIRSEGEAGITALEVPRLYGRQISLWDDMDSIKPVTPEDVTERGQIALSPKLVHTAARAAKLVGCDQQSMIFANIGRNHGIQFGGDDRLWILSPAEVTIPAATAGLPPYWLTGGDTPIAEALDSAVEAVGVSEAEYVEDSPQLAFPDEHAPASVPEIDEGGDDDGASEPNILDSLPAVEE